EEKSNRVLWDQPIPRLYDDDESDFNQNTNVSNSAINVLHIESQLLDRDKVPLLCNNISQNPVQSNKQTKTKRFKSDRISNLSVITKNSIEKTDRKPLYFTDTLACFRHVVKEGKENLSNSEYKIVES
ncbi:8678_t:CDS:1, partial [Cetraspora pellucida]